MANIPFLNNAYFAGKVGIGTESPSVALQLGNSTLGQTKLAIFNSEGGGEVGLTIQSRTNRAKLRVADNDSNAYVVAEAGKAFFGTSANGDATNVTVLTSGNVGIGTTSPASTLDIRGSGGYLQLTSTSLAGSIKSDFNLQLYADPEDGNSSGYQNIQFFTAGASEKMRIDYNGRVGIGTTSPGYKLQVSGGNAMINGGSSNSLFLSISTNYLYGDVNGVVVVAANNNFRLNTNGSERIRVDSSGNVGIGTTNPGSKLTVNSTTAPQLLLTNTGGGNSQILMHDNSGGTQNASITFDQASQNTLTIQTGYQSPSNTNRIYLAPAGHAILTAIGGSGGVSSAKVGIGTITPTRKFVVSNGGGSGIEIEPNYVSGVNEILSFNRTSGATAYETMRFNGGDFQFQIGGTERMRINSAGAVLINATAVRESVSKLSVQGGMSEFETTLTNGNDWANSPISILERGNIGSGSADDKYSPNLNFHWSGRVSNSLWMSDNGHLNWGSYTSAGVPAADGVFRTKEINLIGTGRITGVDTVSASTDAANKAYVDAHGGGLGPFLPLAGGTMTGTNGVLMPDNFRLKIGTSEDLLIFHDGTDSQIFNQAGDLKIRNDQNDGDIVFMSDNGSGGVENYIQIDGSEGRTLFNKNTRLNDNVKAQFGGSGDFNIFHNGLNSYIENDTGDLYIRSNFQDRDIILQSDNGGGGIATYIQIDGSKGSVELNHYGAKKFETTAGGTINTGTIDSTGTITVTGANGNVGINTDTGKLLLGASYDLQIYHDGSNSYIKDAGTGSIIVNGDFFRILNSAGNSQMFRCDANDSVQLYYNNSVKLVTTNTGVTLTGAAAATTFLGDLNGTINTATTGVTQVNSVNNTTIATTAYVNNKIALIPAGLRFEGTWDASTGNPPSASPENGQFWIVSVAGSTSLSGITDWKVGDWAIYVVAGAGTDGWQKVDNSSVLDGSGTGQKVTKWDGSGTSNTLTDGPITFSGNNSTFSGDITMLQTSGNNSLTIDSSGGGAPVIYYKDPTRTWGQFVSNGDLWFKDETSNITSLLLDGGNGNAAFAGAGTFGGQLTVNPNASTSIRIDTAGTNAGLVFAAVGDELYLGANNVHQIRLKTNNDVEFVANATFAGGVVSNAIVQANGFRTTTGSTDYSLLTRNSSNTAVYIQQAGSGNILDVRYGSQAAGQGTSAFAVNSSGNVGIGTTSPSEKLEVVGDIKTSGTGNTQVILESGGACVMDLLNAQSEAYLRTTSAHDLYFRTTNINRMVIKAAGNVGIGTTSPQAALHVAGSFDANSPTGNGVLMGFYSGTHGYMQLNGPSGGYIDFSTSGTDHKGRILYDNTGNYLRLDTNGSEKLRINSAGNVGIGTSIGINKLDVAGNINVMGGNGSYLTFNNGDANIVINNNGTGRDLSFKTYDGSSNAERMRIDKNGNVGIGTTSPGAKLEVRSDGSAAGGAEIRLQHANNNTNDVVSTVNFANNAGSVGMIQAGTAGANNTGYIALFTDIAGSSSERMRVHTNGNVGIGTDSPLGKLMVRADTAGEPTRLIVSNNGTVQSGTSARLSFYEGTSEKGYIERRRDGSGKMAFYTPADDNPFVWENPSGEIMRITNSKVGIGTTSPTDPLTVTSTSNSLGIRLNYPVTNSLVYPFYVGNAAGTSYVRANNTAIAFKKNGGACTLKTEGSTNDLIIESASNLSFKTNGTLNTRMTILAAGNVGIGTTSPNSKLDVRQAVDGIALELHNTGGNVDDFVDIKMIAGNTTSGTLGTILRHQRDGSGGGDFSILTNPTLTGTPTEKLIVKSGGNVGIGTATPTNKLHIQGSQATVYSSTDTGGQASAGTTINNTNTSGNTNNFSQLLFTVGTNNNSVSRIVAIRSGSDASDLAFVGKSTAGVAEYMRIKSGGNVGIGINNPSALLEVRKGSISGQIAKFSAINPHVVIESTTAGNAVLHLKPNATGSKSGQFKVTAGNGYNFLWSNDASGTGEIAYMDLDTSTTGGGDLTVKGDVIAYGSPSDKKYKENIKPIESALDKAMQLQGVTFDWKDSESILEIKEDIGFIAQDVQEVLPELVRDNGKGNLSLRYQGITPILLEAIKELKAEIEELKLNNCNCNK